MAVMREEPEIAEMVKSLISLLKSSIQIGKDTITIQEEIEQIKDYAALQRLRYINSFTVEYNVDDALYRCITLKFVLQPIVENSIFHGIDHEEKGGVISIDIRREGDRIVYRIHDNGRGLSEENLNSLMRDPHDGGKGIGLNNVNRRIKEYFGEEYGIEIESRLGEGTTVKIIIPYVESKAE
jgi:two-component system sensor histidine kinase YesM